MAARQTDPGAAVRQLEALRTVYGPGVAKRKLALLEALGSSFPKDASSLLRLHELLLFLRAYPGSPEILQRVRRLLSSVSARPEFTRIRHELDDTGISGTVIHYPFSYPMAYWLATEYPNSTDISWQRIEDTAALDKVWVLITELAEHPGIDDDMVSSEEWLANASGAGMNVCMSLIRRFESIRCDDLIRRHLYDSLELPLRLTLSKRFPARTNLEARVNKIHYQREQLDRARIDVRRECRRTPEVVQLKRKETRMYIRMARACMAVRHRELEAFDYANPDDGLLFQCGRGLQIVMIGMRPERRLFLESVYGGLMIKNGLPIGYTLASGLFGSSEVAYNMFETFRGGETRWIFGRVLAAVHYLFGSGDFTIMKYQIGYQNDEAIQSGAYWFYEQLGFRPMDRSLLRLLESERRKIERNRSYRSSPAVLRRLSQENVYFYANRPREEVIGRFPYQNIGHLITRHIAETYGGDPGLAAAKATKKAARWLGVKNLGGWPRAEREMFRRWSLLVELLPDQKLWQTQEKRDLVRIIWAKGGTHEASYVRLSNLHDRFREGVHSLVRSLNWEESMPSE